MAKETGLGLTLTVDDSGGTGRDISNDINNLDFATPRGEQDVSGVDLSAHERLLLLADFSVNLNGEGFNDASNQAHDVFKTVPSTSVARTCSIALSGQTLAPEVLFTDYAVTRNSEGAVSWTAPGVLADGTVPTWA
jgi:hypothetical protein